MNKSERENWQREMFSLTSSFRTYLYREATDMRKSFDGLRKESPVRLPLPSHLHREEIVIEPKEDTSGAKKIGEVVTDILKYTPGKFYIKKICSSQVCFT